MRTRITLSLTVLLMCNFIYIESCVHLLQVPKGATNGAINTDNKPGTSGEQNEDSNSQTLAVPDDIYSYYEKIDQDDEEEAELKTVSFEIDQDHLEVVQKRYS